MTLLAVGVLVGGEKVDEVIMLIASKAVYLVSAAIFSCFGCVRSPDDI